MTIPHRVPTPRELEVLRYLAAGMRIGPPVSRFNHPVIAKGVTVIQVRRRTVAQLLEAEWIAPYGDQYLLTPAGRARADCRTFVNAFIESQPSPTPDLT